MNENTMDSVSTSLEVKSSLLPHIPYLLQDLWALGSSVDYILQAVKSLQFGPEHTVLDLGCGKGAVSITLAKNLNVRVVGVDAMKAFLSDANEKAVELQVDDQCEWIQSDIIDYVKDKREFDLVIWASLGGVLGPFDMMIRTLRRMVKIGGYILIDDGYLRAGNSFHRKGYEHYRGYKETIEQLLCCDDQLLLERETRELSTKINTEFLESILRRARELAKMSPELQQDLNDYIDTQKLECRIIGDLLDGCMWVLQKREISV